VSKFIAIGYNGLTIIHADNGANSTKLVRITNSYISSKLVNSV